jgi:alkaline phosphatase D
MSPIGRTRTFPRSQAAVDRLRFAIASCQHFEAGLYTAYQHMAEEDLDLVLHLGDYIYENAGRDAFVRRHVGGELMTIDDYRNRYAQYRSDAALRTAHASFPFLVVWDDHDVDNNYAGFHQEAGAPIEEFAVRRAAGYKAFYEHMPLRRSSIPRGALLQLYRPFTYGTLASIAMLDTRQYRTDQPCGDGTKAPCEGTYDAEATMFGAEQERWLMDGLSESGARWNVLANQVPMSRLDNDPGDAERYSMDRWDGYVAARRRLTGFLHERRPANPIVLTGDVHSNWVGELKADFETDDSPNVGVEFIATSLSSGGDGEDTSPFGQRALAANPGLRFHNNQRGYVRCTVTPDEWRSEYRVLEYVTRPGSPVATRARFTVRNGVPAANAD